MLENFAISPSLPRRQLHILAVDDCIQDLQALFGILKQHGCKISVAFDGKQGYERARLRKPDLILMDVRMPGMWIDRHCDSSKRCGDVRHSDHLP